MPHKLTSQIMEGDSIVKAVQKVETRSLKLQSTDVQPKTSLEKLYKSWDNFNEQNIPN